MEELDIKELFYELKRNIAIIIIFLIIGIAGGIAYTKFLVTPMYRSSTTIVLSRTETGSSSASTITSNDITINQKLISTYSEIIKSRSVINKVKENLKINIEADDIIVQSKKNTELIEIIVRYNNPVMAAKIANNIAEVFTSKIKEVYNIDNVSVIDVAEVATEPDNVNIIKNVGMFSTVTLGFILLIIFIKVYFNNTIKNQAEAERVLGLPVLAVIPKMKE